MWEQTLRRAVELHQKGDLANAEKLYSNVLRLVPGSFDAHHLFGVLRAQQGRYAEALEQIALALKIKRHDPVALANYGKAQMALGRFAQAAATYEQALAQKPGSPDLHYAMGNAFRSLQRLEEANRSYENAIRLKPDFADALNNRGGVLKNLGLPIQALASFEKALSIYPKNAEALNNRGNVLLDLRRYDEAANSCSSALIAKPVFAEAFNNRGIALWKINKIDAALDDFNQALSIQPEFPDALSNRAKLLWGECHNYELAVRDLEQLVCLDPDFPLARGDLLYLRAYGGDWRCFDNELSRITTSVRQRAFVIQPFVFQAYSESVDDLLTCSELYANREYPALPVLASKAVRSEKKVRLGYVCGEFRAHATSYLSVGLYELHDRNRFEVLAFDNGRDDDSPTRRRLEAGFDRIIDVTKLSDQDAAERVLAEEIDILVNLNGYYGDHRMGIFSRKPAPIQVNYLGFPSTLGAAYMDYILADHFVIPEDEQQFYTECVAYLPDTYQVNDDKRPISERIPTRADCCLPEGAFVFCNFNQSYKLTPRMFAVWMRILGQVPGSVLWLWANNATFERNVKVEAVRHGVSGDRIIIAPNIPVADHLARLKLADLFLDSLPYNAHTTASDALWAGLPLLTCTGKTFAGRVATSLLHAVGLPELVTRSLDAYEAQAIELARDQTVLRSLRARLERNRQWPLFDTQRFRSHIEAAYIKMWERWKNGLAPASFSILHKPL
jgi:protein O-GlcNAc transferase